MPYDCPHAVTPKGTIDPPPPRKWVSPLLPSAWGGPAGNRDFWQCAATLVHRLGTGVLAGKRKRPEGRDHEAEVGKKKGSGLVNSKFGGNYTRLDDEDDWRRESLEGGGEGSGCQGKKRLRDAGEFQREALLKVVKSSPDSHSGDGGEYEGRRKRQKMRWGRIFLEKESLSLNSSKDIFIFERQFSVKGMVTLGKRCFSLS